MTALTRKAALAATVAVALLVPTACSSSKGGSSAKSSSSASASSGGSSSTADSGVQAAKAFADKYLAQPQKIDISVPLPSKPPTGKTVYYIINQDPNSTRVANGFKAAADALGWTVKLLTWSDPAQADSEILQAVQAKANYIGYIAVPSSVLTKSLAAARAANIPVFQSFDATTPQGKTNWLFGNIGGTTDFVLRGKINADYVIAQTNGKANVLLENVPAFSVLAAFAQGFKAEFLKNCPTCTYAEINSQYADVAGGKVPATIVSYLRTHTAVNNLVFTTGSFDTGVAQAAQAAGIKIGGTDGTVQITGQALSPANAAAIASGQELANVAANEEYLGWLVADGMARYSVGASLTPNWNTTASPRIITKDTAAQGDDAAAPVNYANQFKMLWKLK